MMFAQGDAEAHLVPELGLRVTLAPGEACVEATRERMHGNARSEGEWTREALIFFEDWKMPRAECAGIRAS